MHWWGSVEGRSRWLGNRYCGLLTSGVAPWDGNTLAERQHFMEGQGATRTLSTAAAAMNARYYLYGVSTQRTDRFPQMVDGCFDLFQPCITPKAKPYR